MPTAQFLLGKIRSGKFAKPPPPPGDIMVKYPPRIGLNVSLSDYKCSSCTLCNVLFAGFLTTSVIISAVFIYFHWYQEIFYYYFLLLI